MCEVVTYFARAVNDFITRTPENIRNVTEWCKKRACWEGIKNLRISCPIEVCKEMISFDEGKIQRVVGVSNKKEKVNNLVEAQKLILKQGSSYWTKVKLFCARNRVQLTAKEQEILDLAIRIPMVMPSEIDCQALIALVKRAKLSAVKKG
jgi:hypothetical protein